MQSYHHFTISEICMLHDKTVRTCRKTSTQHLYLIWNKPVIMLAVELSLISTLDFCENTQRLGFHS